ncbi:dTDP-4-dehydrorhamnose reductase [Streptomyces sp. ME01-24h]|nr:dTDP-4-dehydrorhamnose reductase [Streptomyces sp. ME01-24h]
MSGGWLVTGAGGMLGRDVLDRLAAAGERATGLERAVLDVTDAGAVGAALAAHRPAVVVNAAAWTAVDDAESEEDQALEVNGTGPRVLAEGCRESGAVLLHVSTDYVFAGDATAPYAEDAPVAPRSAYGRTKAVGELAVREALPETGYVVRTAWLYGAGGRNFVRTMIRLEGVKESLDVVNDQRGQPTWTVDLADRLVRLGRAALDGTAPAGVYHGTSAGETTWFGLTREIFSLLGADPERVRPTTSAAFARPAPRPAYSVLGHERWRAAGIEPIRDWREALREAFPSLVEAERRAAAGPFTDR